tara:strand:+ start:136 stop:285 length:150 start_codon:yes stop_codon:yes gene_type:complete
MDVRSAATVPGDLAMMDAKVARTREEAALSQPVAHVPQIRRRLKLKKSD